EALTWLPLEAGDPVPLLVEAVTSTKLAEKAPKEAVYVRNAAAAALGRLGEKAREAIPALVGALQKTTADELRLSLLPVERGVGGATESGPMQALRRIGKPAVPALVPLLKDSQWVVRWQAATVLGGMGPAAKEALEPLQAALTSENESFPVISATA